MACARSGETLAANVDDWLEQAATSQAEAHTRAIISP